MRTVGFALAGLLLSAVCARAEAPNYEAAGKHFSAAREAFDHQHFKVAAGEFQAAYEVARDPLLLYNIGESWEKAGEGRKAVDSYKAYLKAQPQAQDRADVQKRIKQIVAKKFKLKSQSAPGDEPKKVEMAQVAPPPPAPPPPVPPPPPPAPVAAPEPELKPLPNGPPPQVKQQERTLSPDFAREEPVGPGPTPSSAAASPQPVAAPVEPNRPPLGFLDDHPPSKMRIAAWVGVATTVAVLTAGAIFGLAAQSRADEITRRETFVDTNGQPKQFDATQQSDYASLKSDGNLYNGLAIGFFAAAGATAIVTTVLFVLDVRARNRAMEIAPAVGKEGASLSLKWSF